jgi:hypothetical protein
MMESLLGLPMQAMMNRRSGGGGYMDFSKPQPVPMPEEQASGMPSQLSMNIRNAVQGGMNATGIPQFAQGIQQGGQGAMNQTGIPQGMDQFRTQVQNAMPIEQMNQLRATLQAQLPQQAINNARSFIGNNIQRPFAQNVQQPINNAVNPLMGRFFGR